MEHIAIPSDPAFAAPKVPWLGMIYDGQGFHQYPERMGWNRVSHNGMYYLLRDDDLEEDEEFDKAFHQAWLFTALLVEALRAYDVVVNFSNFLRREGDETFITTEHLPSYIDEMVYRDKQFDLEERRSRLAEVLTILEMAANFAACAASAGGLHSSSLSDEVALSVLLLGQCLQNVVRFMAEDLVDEDGPNLPEGMIVAFKGFKSMNSKLLKERLDQAGWCKSDIKLLEDHLDVENLYYASMLSRNGIPKDHSTCSKDTCLAHQIVEGTYETRHVRSDCKCAHISVDVAIVGQTLRDGGIPAVKIITEGEGTDVKLEVVDVMRHSQPYLAISHVWSDGLGNETANSLPKCQIQKLQGICAMMRISGSHQRDVTVHSGETNRNHLEIQLAKNRMPIWIDTLCVPLNQHRHLALEKIGRTFREASSVLVLDTELQHASLHARWQELCIRVAISGWSRRLWTFQEAALATNRLWFQFREGPVDLWRRTMDSLNEGYDSRSFRSMSDEAAMIFFRRRAIPLFEGESDLFTFVWMAQCLLFRRTSKLRDEPFCLASTLGLDTHRILSFATLEERMREFFAMLRVIPSTVFFLRGTKLQFPGYRWAPTTFLETGSNPVVRWRGEEVTRIAQRDGNNIGLRVSLPGCLISFTKAMDPEAKGSVIWTRKATLADSFLVEIENRDDWRRVCHLEKVVLVTENDMNLPLGFLASIRKEDDDAISLDYLCAVNVTPLKEMINWESIDHQSEKMWQGNCTREFVDQMWCVG